jgi:hypothetical protein
MRKQCSTVISKLHIVATAFANAYLWVVVFAALDIIQAYGINLIEKNE